MSLYSSDAPILPVSIFTQLVSDHLSALGEVVVEGEISQLQLSQGRWLFLTLKDAQASISVFAPAFKITSLDSLAEGMKVHVYGTASLYQKTGRFSLNAYRIVPAGEGALKQAYEKLKAKLQTEGLFDPTRKRSLPRFPQTIGLITAVGARAYSDFLKILSERMGGLQIQFYPIQVQGKDSVASILSAFTYFNHQVPAPDVLVLTRGGGSLEDLLSFNDEAVARAVFGSKIPVISAIGHEEDVALTDYVADVRASTPTNAAELLVSDRQTVSLQVRHLTLQLEHYLTQELQDQKQLLRVYADTLARCLTQPQHHYSQLLRRYTAHLQKIQTTQLQLTARREQLLQQLWKTPSQLLQHEQQHLKELQRLLQSLDYQTILSKGFSITRLESGAIVTDAQSIPNGTKIHTTLKKGRLISTTT